ncbi:pro-neuregulin-2, membrane-bound isoform-like isoform X2 [Artemia franciscana]|uniref:Protein vein n=1 Tax=Artemia franciscana TaxID=6661 RepID=A0AA88LL23_ARTSF|nr:hypothetical protein QYM36_000470 [Artemia franciscana]
MWLMRAYLGRIRPHFVICLMVLLATGVEEIAGVLCFPDESFDAASRAYVAPIVFSGKVRSRGDNFNGGVYRTVFDVHTVYKGNIGVGAQVKLDFFDPDAKNSIRLRRRSRKHSILLRRCILAASVQPGKRYIVFASEITGGNYSVVSAPILQSKKTTREVRSIVCKKCAKPPAAAGLRDVKLTTRHRLMLKCRIKGNPIPSVIWFKDGKELRPSKRIKIKTRRRKSNLRITCLKEEDAGIYECRPSSIMGQGSSTKARVTVTKSPRMSLRPGNVSSTLWPLIAVPCPIESFCLNGGTCKYYEAVGELVCHCAEGYKGQRCESKDLLGNIPRDHLSLDATLRTLALYLGK